MPPKARGGRKARQRPESPDPAMSPTMARYFDSQSTTSGDSSGSDSDTESTGSSGSTGTRDSSVSGSSFRSGSDYSSNYSSEHSSASGTSASSATYSDASSRTSSTIDTDSTGEGAHRRRKWGKQFKRLEHGRESDGQQDHQSDGEPEHGRRADWFTRRGAKVDKVVGNLSKRFDIPTTVDSEPQQLLTSGLPPGWQSVRDEDSGNVYYWNSTTNETTWERPQPQPQPPELEPEPEPEPEPKPEEELDPVLSLQVDADWSLLWEQLAERGWKRANAPQKAEGVGWQQNHEYYYIPPARGPFQMLTAVQLHSRSNGSLNSARHYNSLANPRSHWVSNSSQSMPSDGWSDLERETIESAAAAAAAAGISSAGPVVLGIKRDYYDTPEQVVAYVTQLQSEIRALPEEVDSDDPLAPSVTGIRNDKRERLQASAGSSSAAVAIDTPDLSFKQRSRHITLGPEAPDEWSRCRGSLLCEAGDQWCRVQGDGTRFLLEIQPGDIIRVSPKIELVTFEETALVHQEREVTAVWSDTELDVREPFSLLLDGSLPFHVRRVAAGMRVGGYFSGSNPQAVSFVRELEETERVATQEAERKELLAQATADYHELDRQRRMADPSTPEYMMQQGNAAFRKKDFEAAEAAFTAALRCDVGKIGYGIELATSPHLIYCNRSAARLRLHKKALALRDAKTACKLGPLQPTAHYRAAKAHASLARWEDSAASIEAAARQLLPPPGCDPDDEQEEENTGVVKQIEAGGMLIDDQTGTREPVAAKVEHNESIDPTATRLIEDKSAESTPAKTSSGKLALLDVFRADDDDDDDDDDEKFFGSDSDSDSDSESQATEQAQVRGAGVDVTETKSEGGEEKAGGDDSKTDDSDDDESSAATESTRTESASSTGTGSSRSASTGTAASSTATDSSRSQATSTTSSISFAAYKTTRIRLAWGRGTNAVSDDSLAARIIALADEVTPCLAALRRKGEEGDPLNPNYKPPRGVGPGMVPPPPPPTLLVEVLDWKENPGGKVVYTIQAECESGLVVRAEHRYSSLDALNKKLEDVLLTANTDSTPPSFPGKSFFGGGGSDVAEGRRFQLNQWLPAVLSLDEDCDGDLIGVVMDHLFGANYDSLSQHIAALKAEGYDDVSLLRDATVGDLEELGIHRVHAEEIIQRVKDALAAEQPGEPPLRVALKTLLKDKEGGMGDESASSDDDDNSTVTSTSRSTRTESTAHGGDSPTSSRSSTSSSSSDAGFGGGGGDEWKPGELLAGFGKPVVDLEKAAMRGGTKVARRSNNAFEEKIRATHRGAGNQNW